MTKNVFFSKKSHSVFCPDLFIVAMIHEHNLWFTIILFSLNISVCIHVCTFTRDNWNIFRFSLQHLNFHSKFNYNVKLPRITCISAGGDAPLCSWKCSEYSEPVFLASCRCRNVQHITIEGSFTLHFINIILSFECFLLT